MTSEPHQPAEQSESPSVYASSQWFSHGHNLAMRSNTIPGLASVDEFAVSAPPSSVPKSPLGNISSNSAMQPPPTQHPAASRPIFPASSSDRAGTEKEEGEVSEGGSSNNSSVARRSLPAKTCARRRHAQTTASRSDLSLSAEGNQISHDLTSRRERAKDFILIWTRSGLSFQQLIREGFDPHFLSPLYEELGIPVETSVPSFLSDTQDSATAEVQSSSTNQHPLHTTVSEADMARKRRPNKPQQPASTAPQSDQSKRQGYIARLMAVKGKKTSSENPDGPPQAASASEKPDEAPQVAITSSRPQSSDHIDSNLPTPPVYNAALSSLNFLSRKLGVTTSFIFNQTREQSFGVELHILTFPEHLQPHLLRILDTEEDQPATCLGAAVSIDHSILNTRSTLRICLQDFKSKKAAKQGAARVASTVITAAIEAYEQQPSHNLGSDDPQPSTTAPTKHSESKGNDDEQDANGTSTGDVITKTSLDATAPVADTSSVARKKAQNDLLKLKLQALRQEATIKAAQAASASALDNPAAPSGSSSPASGSAHSDALSQSLGRENIALLTSSSSEIPGLSVTAPAGTDLTSTAVGSSKSQSTLERISSILSSLEDPSTVKRVMRKRPVAADFNDDVETPITKRPFGQIRGGEEDETIIIEASDDELDFDSDLDSKSTDMKPSATPTKAFDRSTSRKLASSGPLRSVGAENSYQSTGRAQTPVDGSNGLDRRQKEIVEMKKRIAAMEAKRHAKLHSSRPNTPSSVPGSNVQAELPKDKLPSDGQLNVAPVQQQLSEGSSRPSANPEPSSTHLHPSGTDENSSAIDTKSLTSAGSLEWKQHRRSQIKHNIPALETGLDKDSQELERLQLLTHRLQESIKQKQENKKLLLEELESLGVDTDGTTHSELQATKNFMHKSGQNEEGKNNTESIHTQNSALPEAAENSSPSSMSISSPEEPNSVPLALNNSGDTEMLGGHSMAAQHASLVKDAHVPRSSSHSDESNLYSDSAADDAAPIGMITPPSQPSSKHEEQTDTPVGNSIGSSAHFADNESMSSNGGDVETPENRALTFPENEDHKDRSNANHNSGYLETSMAVDEPDPYEPSDPWEADHPSNVADVASPANAGREPGGDTEMASLADVGRDLERDTENSQMDESEDEYEPTDHHEHSEKQMVEESSLGSKIPGVVDYGQDHSQLDFAKELPPAKKFTQYRSTLKSLKSGPGSAPTDGEAHPSSSSPQIDHQREICRFELAGGVCNDWECDHQHFRSMNIEGMASYKADPH